MPDITRTLTDFQTFAVEHNISLVRINIQKLIDKMGKRGRLLSDDTTGADEVWGPLESSVMKGYRREVIALMTLTLLLWKHRVGIHFHILHLQVFTRDDSQNYEVDLEKEIILFSHIKTYRHK